jgi:hypothetical protein
MSVLLLDVFFYVHFEIVEVNTGGVQLSKKRWQGLII